MASAPRIVTVSDIQDRAARQSRERQASAPEPQFFGIDARMLPPKLLGIWNDIFNAMEDFAEGYGKSLKADGHVKEDWDIKLIKSKKTGQWMIAAFPPGSSPRGSATRPSIRDID